MAKLFAVSSEDFRKAVYGDQETIKKIADMARLSEVAKTNLPKALESYRQIIETTGNYNQALTELVKLTQQHGTQTMKAIYSARQGEQRMGNELQELAVANVNTSTTEATRHAQRMSLIQIEGTTADLMAVAKYQADLAKAANKVPDAQDAADLAYEKAVATALWAQGSEAKTDRIPKPNYHRTAGLSRVWQGFRRTMGL